MAELKQPEVPKTMKGVLITKYTEKNDFKSGLKLEEALPVPAVAKDQVLVSVVAASINPVDWKVLTGYLSLIKSPPFVPGFDFAGRVVAVGNCCKRIKVGDLVYGMNHYQIMGTFAKFVTVPEKNVALKPADLTFAEAASIPLAGLTSYQALLEGKLAKGSKVLILGGSGGCGSIGVQLAKAMGASHVAATCSQRNVDFVRGLGADEVIDYNAQAWHEVLKGQNYDLIYDTVGGYESWVNSASVLKPSGASYVTIAGDKQSKLTISKLFSSGASIVNRKFWSLFGYASYSAIRCDAARADQLDLFSKMVQTKQLRATVEKVFPHEEYSELYEHSASGRTVGKVCLAITPDFNQKI